MRRAAEVVDFGKVTLLIVETVVVSMGVAAAVAAAIAVDITGDVVAVVVVVAAGEDRVLVGRGGGALLALPDSPVVISPRRPFGPSLAADETATTEGSAAVLSLPFVWLLGWRRTRVSSFSRKDNACRGDEGVVAVVEPSSMVGVRAGRRDNVGPTPFIMVPGRR